MAERGHRSTHGDRGVFRLVVDYVRCPECELVVPAFTGPEPLAAVTDGTMTRCGFCKWVFPPGPRLVLELRRSCADCGTTMRAPVGAAVLVCPACDGWFYNPELDEAGRARAEAVLHEQRRIAAMVDRVLAATDQLIPPSRQPEPERADLAAHGVMSPGATTAWATLPAASPPAPSQAGPSQAGPSQAGLNPAGLNPAGLALDRGALPEHRLPAPRSGGNVRVLHGRGHNAGAGTPMTVAFANALSRAVQDALGPRQRRVLELRYGLDGRPGRTFREIGAVLRRSPSRARDILDQGVRRIAELARLADLSRSRQHMSCSIAVHVAAHAVGDPLDPATPARIRAFIEATLPWATPDAATDLLLRLSGRHDELVPFGQHRALRRAVVAAGPAPGTR